MIDATDRRRADTRRQPGPQLCHRRQPCRRVLERGAGPHVRTFLPPRSRHAPSVARLLSGPPPVSRRPRRRRRRHRPDRKSSTAGKVPPATTARTAGSEDFFPTFGEEGCWPGLFRRPIRNAEGRSSAASRPCRTSPERKGSRNLAAHRSRAPARRNHCRQPGGHLRPRRQLPGHALESRLRGADRRQRPRDDGQERRLAGLLPPTRVAWCSPKCSSAVPAMKKSARAMPATRIRRRWLPAPTRST